MTTDQLLKLYNKIKTLKSPKAIDKNIKTFTDEAIRLTRRANARMRALERAGYDYGSAYDRLAYYNEMEGRTRLRERSLRNADLADILHEAVQANAFLSSPQSSVIGQQKIEAKRINQFRAIKREDGSPLFGEQWTDSDVMEFQRFLGTDYSDYLEYYADSSDAVELLVNVLEEAADREETYKTVAELMTSFTTYTEWVKDHPNQSPREAPGMSFPEVRAALRGMLNRENR